MYAQRLKLGTAAVLVVLVAVMGAAVGVATAQCAFTLTATPSSAAPDASVALDAKCLHDAFGNKIPGATVTFDVTLPDGTVATQTAVTDANGDASVTHSDTSQYGSYSAKASSGTANASASFSVAPGAPAGTFSVSASPPSAAAGSGVTLTAKGITDSATPGGKPVANGTPVSFKVTGPTGVIKTYSATTSGVSKSTDMATASASVPGADVQKAGTYSVSATAGTASATGTGSFGIVAGALASLKAVAPASVLVPSTGHSLGAKDAADEFGNTVSGAAVNLHLEDSLGGTLDQACTTDAGACSVSVDWNAPDQPYGEYRLTASSGSVSDGPLAFDAQPGPAETIGSIAPSSSSVPAATSVTITVNNIRAAGPAAAKSGTGVNLSVIGPSGTKSYSGTVTGVDSRLDTASVAITIPGADNTKAGSYAVHATADGAMADTTYTVVAGPPVADLIVTAPDVRVEKPNTVSVSGIPSSATSVELTVTKPSGATLTKTVTPSADGTASFALTGAETAELGFYGLGAKAKNAAGETVGGGSGSFKTTQAALAVSAPDTTLGETTTVTVAGIPDDGTSVDLTVTRPDGTTLSKSAAAPCDPISGACSFAGGSTSFGLSATELNQTGTYGLSAIAKSAGGAAIATGSGSFQVAPAPVLSVSAPDVRAGKGNSVTISNLASGAQSVDLTVTRPGGSTFLKTALGPFAGGSTTIALTAAELNEVGTYGLSALSKNAAGDSISSGSGSFSVSLGTLTVTAPNAIVGSSNQVTVSNLDADATSVSLTVTRPDGSTVSKMVEAPCDQLESCSFANGSTKIGLSAADLNQTGTYGLSAVSKNSAGTIIESGTGSFSVGPAPTVGPEPTTIVVTTSPSGTINPTQQVFMTATATAGTGPSFNRTLVFEVHNALGMLVFSGARVTDSQGKATLSVGGSLQRASETALPGEYKITVRYIPTGTFGTGSFRVLI